MMGKVEGVNCPVCGGKGTVVLGKKVWGDNWEKYIYFCIKCGTKFEIKD